MSRGNLILFNKPFGVVSQFTGNDATLAQYIPLKGYYPAGRLDRDSEGLLLLTDDGSLQARIASPKFKMAKTYWAQVEGDINRIALDALANGISLKDGQTRPAKARKIEAPLPPRSPDIRQRASIPASWVELTITEGRHRQVRRMTAAVGFPTLRLFRSRIGPWSTEALAPGEHRLINVNF